MTMNEKEKATDRAVTNSTNREYLSKLETLLSTVERATKEEPVTRHDLSWILGCRDREVRDYIDDLRDKGYRICMKTVDGGGYWLAKTDSEYAAFRKQYLAYPRTAERRARAMDRGPIEGQVMIGE